MFGLEMDSAYSNDLKNRAHMGKQVWYLMKTKGNAIVTKIYKTWHGIIKIKQQTSWSTWGPKAKLLTNMILKTDQQKKLTTNTNLSYLKQIHNMHTETLLLLQDVKDRS